MEMRKDGDRMFTLDPKRSRLQAIAFCRAFAGSRRPKYILGRNEYAESIAQAVEVTGIIDDFALETECYGKPVVKMAGVPRNSLVVSAVLGRPSTAARNLNAYGLGNLDYFAFAECSGLPVKPVKFWSRFREDFEANNDRYQWVYGLLADDESRSVFRKIIHFRLYGDLWYMQGFMDHQDNQYFEEFLGLAEDGETFVDAGAYDGKTSLQLIKRCPRYRSVHVFEPDPENMLKAKELLGAYPSIEFHEVALSDRIQELGFVSGGSVSRISEVGPSHVPAQRLDAVVDERVTFIKMDIEGSEKEAIEGSRNTIHNQSPRLAISVYHDVSDFRSIPRQVLSLNPGYRIHLRHYTEGVDETVMFFVPC